MTHTRLRQWLALNLCNPVLGARRAHQLISDLGDIDAVFRSSFKELCAAGLSPRAAQAICSADWVAVEAAQAWADVPGRHLICYDDPAYPALLRQICDPPLVLYCEGKTALLSRHALAIVGSRSPTPSGMEIARSFAAQLSRLGFCIVSGMALGIDGAAHHGCLGAEGATLAVVGTGLDRVYPARHTALAEQIRTTGLLVSEFPLGTAPLARHFPQRNRIISGLVSGVLVVEAGIHSGSLITAHQAMDQGREVFAIPGSIHNPTSKGCHHLLREGAKLVDTVDDILDELGGVTVPASANSQSDAADPPLPAGAEYPRLYAALDATPASVEQLVERSGLTPDAVCSMLLVLELQNLVHITGTGQYCRVFSRSEDEREHPRCADVSV